MVESGSWTPGLVCVSILATFLHICSQCIDFCLICNRFWLVFVATVLNCSPSAHYDCFFLDFHGENIVLDFLSFFLSFFESMMD